MQRRPPHLYFHGSYGIKREGRGPLVKDGTGGMMFGPIGLNIKAFSPKKPSFRIEWHRGKSDLRYSAPRRQTEHDGIALIRDERWERGTAAAAAENSGNVASR